MRSPLLRLPAAFLAVALVAAPAAQAAIAFKGFSAQRSNALRSDLAKSLFPFSTLLDVVVVPGDLPPGALGLATSRGQIILDEEAFASPEVRTFALLHELSHQIDYQLLRDGERGRFYEAAGFGQASAIRGYADPDWYDESLPHDRIGAEQFASAIPLVVWPASKGNTYVAADGTCIGWEQGEGCAAPLEEVRAIVDAVLAQQGLPPLGGSSGDTGVFRESFVPPRTAAPAERTLRAPDAGVPAVATSLAAVASLAGVTKKKASVLRVRLRGPGGALPGVTVVLDYRDKDGWWQLGELTTDLQGEIAYRFRAKGWRPTAFRVTFVGAANLQGASVLVPVRYR